VEAPGIEADSGHDEITIEHQSGTIGIDADPANVSDRAPKCAIVRGVVTESSEAYELSNVVETALARALVLRRRRSAGTLWVGSPPASRVGDLSESRARSPTELRAIVEPERSYFATGRSP